MGGNYILPKNYKPVKKTDAEIEAEVTAKETKKTNIKPIIKTFVNGFGRPVYYDEIWKHINSLYPNTFTTEEVIEVVRKIDVEWEADRPVEPRTPRGK